MLVISLILLILAAGCFAAAAFNVASPRVNLIALGLLFWVVVPLIATIDRL
jgi:predicted S18 family serine protease